MCGCWEKGDGVSGLAACECALTGVWGWGVFGGGEAGRGWGWGWELVGHLQWGGDGGAAWVGG